MHNLLFFAQKIPKSFNVSWGTAEVITILSAVVVALFLYEGLLKLLKIFFPEKFYVNLKPELEEIVRTPAKAELPEEFTRLLKKVSESITSKENNQRQEKIVKELAEVAYYIKELHEWHKPDKFDKPQWYCVCAMKKSEPKWETLLEGLEKVGESSEDIKNRIEGLKIAHKSWSESVIATNQQMSQMMTSLIGFLNTVSERNNEDH